MYSVVPVWRIVLPQPYKVYSLRHDDTEESVPGHRHESHRENTQILRDGTEIDKVSERPDLPVRQDDRFECRGASQVSRHESRRCKSKTQQKGGNFFKRQRTENMA